VEIPEGSVQADLDSGEATLHLQNVCSVFDAFTVPNSFDVHHALGLVGAVVESLNIHWTGIKRKLSFSNGVNFRATSVESVAAPMSVTTSTPASKPPFTPTAKNGFEFVSDPTSTVTNFALIAQVNNGALF
jgi:hypothetical protein